jgi:hypothetical protein
MSITIRHTESFDRSGPRRRIEVSFFTVRTPGNEDAFRVTETADAISLVAGQVTTWGQTITSVQVWRATGWVDVETFRCAEDGIESDEHAVRVALVLIGRGA